LVLADGQTLFSGSKDKTIEVLSLRAINKKGQAQSGQYLFLSSYLAVAQETWKFLP